jgi:dihydrodipicolinate synthase/N-acetylneuraminate lyase
LLIDGIHVPLTAPFQRDGRGYWRKLEYNVGRYSLTPAAGLVALPPEGEAAMLSDAEIRETLEIVGASAAPEKVLIAGVAKDSVRGALEIAGHAASAGFDAVVLSPPQGMSVPQQQLFLVAVADASPLPVLLYSGALSVARVGELAWHRNILGAYEAGLTRDRYAEIVAATSGVKRDVTVTPVFAPVTRRMVAAAAAPAANFVTAQSLAGGTAVAAAPPQSSLKTRTQTRIKTVGFQVMSAGAATGLVELLETGVAGAMPVLAACAPQGCYEAFAAFKDGDPALAAEKEQRLAAAETHLHPLGAAGIKYGCDLNGYYGGPPRLPRLPLLATERAEVEAALSGLRN